MKSGFDALGQPVPYDRRQKAYDHARKMGVEDAFPLIDAMAHALAKDRPFEAMKAAEGRVDLTGAYVLMAELLT